jgi:hypothetical protein
MVLAADAARVEKYNGRMYCTPRIKPRVGVEARGMTCHAKVYQPALEILALDDRLVA